MTPWEEMASRQGVWSGTADNLKRNHARDTLCLSECRTHVSLDKDAPLSRAAEVRGHAAANHVLGGLHHQYCRIRVFDSDTISKSKENLANG